MFITVFKTLLLPPALPLILIFFCFLIWKRWRIFSRLLFALSLGSLLTLSLPFVSYKLFTWLEAPYLEQQVLQLEPDQKSAIVVLGGGRWQNSPEYPEDQLSPGAFWRVRYAAHLAKTYKLPIIATGGTVLPYEQVPEAAMAAKVLHEELGIEPSKIIEEGQSRTTWENAKFTAEILKQEEIEQVVLVTSAYHMRRAVFAFNRMGIEVIPKPTGFYSLQQSNWIDDWIPQSEPLHLSKVALHEYIGLVVYRLY